MEETANRQFVELERTHFWFVGRRRIFFTLLDRELAGRRDLRVLDVGCGAGGMLEPLARYGQVTGVDMQPELVRVLPPARVSGCGRRLGVRAAGRRTARSTS